MNSIEIKEILPTEIEQYKMFLSAALQGDEENLLITLKENSDAPFPTKNRNDSFTLGAYAENVLAGVVSFARDGEDREKLRHKGMIFTMFVSKEFRGHGIAGELLEELIVTTRWTTTTQMISALFSVVLIPRCWYLTNKLFHDGSISTTTRSYNIFSCW